MTDNDPGPSLEIERQTRSLNRIADALEDIAGHIGAVIDSDVLLPARLSVDVRGRVYTSEVDKDD